MLYTTQELKSCLFFDIETKPQAKSLKELPEKLASVWKEKYAKRSIDKELEERKKHIVATQKKYESIKEQEIDFDEDYIFVKYAPLYAEFGKVLCISIGVLDDKLTKTVVTLANNETEESNEREALKQFRLFCDGHPELKLAGFNIKGFDIPFLIKRYLLLGEQLPKALQLRNKKPWEVFVLDIMEDWKGMGWEMTGLETIAVALGLPSPKEEFQNYEMNILLSTGKITVDDCVKYCERDVNTEIDVALKFSK